MVDAICRHCRWWGVDHWTRKHDGGNGTCQRHAPMPVMLVTVNRHDQGGANFPHTTGRDFCGDFLQATSVECLRGGICYEPECIETARYCKREVRPTT